MQETSKVTEARLNYYAPLSKVCPAENKGQRAWAHTDYGLITLLLQDAAGGLEIEDRDRPGTFIPIIREDPTETTVYISDIMERSTNGFLRAALYQLAIPVGIDNNETGVLPEIYSVASSFIRASRDTFTGPLPHFVDFGHPAKVLGMTAIELHRKRVRQLYVDWAGEVEIHSRSVKIGRKRSGGSINRL